MQPDKYYIIGAKTFTLFLLLFCLTSGITSAGEIFKPAEQTGLNLFNVNPKDTLRTDDSLYYDDSDDEEMYAPYEKWRIDTFDNWGKHKRIYSPDTSAADTNNLHKQKGLSDKDKEAMLLFPLDRIGVENVRVYVESSKCRHYNLWHLISFNKYTSV
jgi:hypothetical protein